MKTPEEMAEKCAENNDAFWYYESIQNAPKIDDLIKQADARGVPIEVVLREERMKQYRCVDTTTGTIYLIKNPAARSRRRISREA